MMGGVKALFLSLMGALCCASFAAAQEQAQPAAPAAEAATDKTAVPAHFLMSRDSEHGQVIVNCTMDGVPLRLLLDTGATHTVLHKGVAEEKLPNAYKLDTTGMQITGNAAGLRPDILVIKLGIAGGTRSQHPVLVMPLDGVRSMLQNPVDGILGMDVLSHIPFTLDFRQGGVSHWGADTDGKAFPLNAHPDMGGCPLVTLRIGEKVLDRVLLDSGSTTTLIEPKDWEAGEGESCSAQVADVNGRREVKISFGKPAPAELAPGLVRELTPQLQEGMNRSSSAAILGIESLQGLRLIYDPEKGFSLMTVEE